MRIRTETLTGTGSAVVRCVGDLIYRAEADHVREQVWALDRELILIDLASVRVVDAYGIGRLLEVLHHARSNQRKVLLINPNQRLHELLRLTKLNFCFTPPYCSSSKPICTSEGVRDGERSESIAC